MKTICSLLLSLTLLYACCTEDKEETMFSSIPVHFCVGDVASRGNLPLETNGLFTMGVFAGYEEENERFGPTSVANDYIDNVRYTRQELSHPFAGDDMCYWPFAGRLSFFAYAPYVSSQNIQFSNDYTAGYPRMSYRPTLDVTNQPDFCIATPVLDQHQTTEPIPLHFNHALAQVLFSANYTGELPYDGLYLKVDSIRVCNVIGQKTLIMSDGTPCFEWQADNECPPECRTSYLLRRGGGAELSHLADKQLGNTPGTYVDLTRDNGRLYLLPQQTQHHGDIYLEVTFGYYEMVGGAEVLRASTSTRCDLPETEWLPTNSYRYRFTINLANNTVVNPSVSVEAWKDVHKDADSTHLE